MLIIKDNRLYTKGTAVEYGPMPFFILSLAITIALTYGSFNFIVNSWPMIFCVLFLLVVVPATAFLAVVTIFEWSNFGAKFWIRPDIELSLRDIAMNVKPSYFNKEVYQEAIQEAYAERLKFGEDYDLGYWSKLFSGLNEEMELIQKAELESKKQALYRTDFIEKAKDYRKLYVGE